MLIDDVLPCLVKVHCLPHGTALVGCALRGLTAIGKGETPDVNAESTSTSVEELGHLLHDAGSALLEQAGLLAGQRGRGGVCAALKYLSFRCFCAVDVLRQATSGVSADAVPEGDALWGAILQAWFGVRDGGGFEGALADLTRWWITHTARGVDVGCALAPTSLEASGISGMFDAMASMLQQAEWLRGTAAEELRSETAAGHIESAVAAAEQLSTVMGSSNVVGVRRLRPVSGLDLPIGVRYFESRAVHVLQTREELAPDFNTGQEDVEDWSGNVAVGAAALALSVAALMRSEGARLAQGLPVFAQSIKKAALHHVCSGASGSDPVGSRSIVTLQVQCEVGWPLSQVVLDEAWDDVGVNVRQKLGRAVLGTCAAAGLG